MRPLDFGFIPCGKVDAMTDINTDTYFEALERTGITQHPGGIDATHRLAQRIGVTLGQRLLDIGCGTGYTACSLAKEYGVEVVAVDLRPGILEWASQRVRQEGAEGRVTLRVADAQALPFQANAFDTALAESVLVFCDQERAASEMHRVLKPGGRFGSNELTVLKPLPIEVREVLVQIGMGSSFLSEQEWRAVFKEAGFVEISSTTAPISLLEAAVLTPLRTDGIRKYLSSLLRNIADPNLRTFATSRISWRMMRLLFGSYFGYGLYAGKKAER